MKKIFFAILLLTAFAANAKEITVTAYGEGEDYDWAVMRAVENAVRQTADISIAGHGLRKVDAGSKIMQESGYDSEGNADDKLDAKEEEKGFFSKKNAIFSAEGKAKGNYKENSKDVVTANVYDNSKEILAKYSGLVTSYEVLEHKVENGLHKVTIKAVVKKEASYDPEDYKSKDLIKKADYSLAIMPFKFKQSFTCLDKPLDARVMNASIANLFIENLAPSRKFRMLDRNNFDDIASETWLIEHDLTLAENKARLRNIVSADYILVGTVDHFSATTKEKTLEFTGETSRSSKSKLKISYRILETATSEVVAAGSVEEKFKKDKKFSSCDNVRELLLKRAIEKASKQILQDLFPDYKPQKKAVEKKAKSQNKKDKAAAAAPDYALPLY